MTHVIGLMSGTSLDGVDAAWIATDGVKIGEFGPSVTVPYGAALKAALRALIDRAPGLKVDDPVLLQATEELTRVHAEAVGLLGKKADLPGASLIGFHGQTILHRPDQRRTWQIGDAGLLARLTGMDVAYDFRTRDVAAGGQGAPLVPFFHQALATDMQKPLAVLNLGGVGNVTWLGHGDEILACDTGPGNALIDDWARAHLGTDCDLDGALAAAGAVDFALLARWLGDPFFAATGPKSLDRQSFARFLADLDGYSAADGAATLVALTAHSVAATRLPVQPRRWLVGGGGRHNPTLMAALRDVLGVAVEPVEAVGWDGDALEAQAFGFLAVRVRQGMALSGPTTTGVPWAMTGGKIARA